MPHTTSQSRPAGRSSVMAAAVAMLLISAGCSAGGGDTTTAGTAGAGGGHASTSATSMTTSTTSTGAQSTTVSGTSTGSGTTGATSTTSTGGGASCATLPLCDDLEKATAGGPPDPSKWMVVSPNCMGTGTVSVDGTMAHSGSNSVKVSGKGGYCNHVFFANTTAIGTLGGVVWSRFFVRLSDALGGGHTTFLAMKDTNDGGKDLRMGGQNMILMYNRESDDATLPALSPTGVSKSLPLPVAKWTCVELMIDGPNGHLETYVDGTKRSEEHTSELQSR